MRPFLTVLLAGVLVAPVPALAAVAPADAAAALAAPSPGCVPVVPERNAANPCDPRNWVKQAPDHYTPPGGARFNNPYGGTGTKRRVLTHVIRAIGSAPGYELPHDPAGRLLVGADGKPVACPENAPWLYPSEIKISLYSIADRAFADAVVAAQRRCVSVQVLMNSHLNATTSRSWGRIADALGPRGSNWKDKRSFAHRCSHGCIGSSVLHTKFYLFSRAGAATSTVMVGSSNMTSNAVKVQWNDLFTVNGNRTMYEQYRKMFLAMVPDVPGDGPRVFRAGGYTSTFYPFRRATASTDRTMRDLRSIRCSGARGGAGISGHTVLYVLMHSWHGTRGRYLAQRVRQMYDRGCYVRILYSFMGKGTYHLLTANTGPRMVARRDLFAGRRGIAIKYSHMKMFAASGNVGGDPSAWVTWTGSNNWSDRTLRADEVTLRIPSRSVYRSYVAHWNYIRSRHSVSTWAIYPEPGGGGRAPDKD